MSDTKTIEGERKMKKKKINRKGKYACPECVAKYKAGTRSGAYGSYSHYPAGKIDPCFIPEV